MFERFTREARDLVEAAQGAAREAGSRAVDSRHLLLALVERSTASAADLSSLRVQPMALASSLRVDLRAGGLDREALASVGIDLDAVRERADAVFGEGALDRGRRPAAKGHIPFSSDAKKVLELALREAIRLRTNRIDDRMLLLGMLRGTGSPAEQALRQALTDVGSSVDALRAVVERATAQAS
jgi:ATP-dependent Clp protease ATP-binding subunit ClpA